MVSLNINNLIKSSLDFVHRGTVVFLKYFGPFSNQRPFQSLHPRVWAETTPEQKLKDKQRLMLLIFHYSVDFLCIPMLINFAKLSLFMTN